MTQSVMNMRQKRTLNSTGIDRFFFKVNEPRRMEYGIFEGRSGRFESIGQHLRESRARSPAMLCILTLRTLEFTSHPSKALIGC